jgi:hypothetical protein
MNEGWYDNIPEQGVLCWGQEFVSTPDDITYKRILTCINEVKHINHSLPIYHKDITKYPIWFLSRGTGKWYVYAVPLTNEEIEGFKLK